MLKKMQVFLLGLVLLAIAATGLFCLFFLSQYSDSINSQVLESASRLFIRDVRNGSTYSDAAESCQEIFEDEDGSLRITLIDDDGTVIFDNFEDASSMENHSDRPEVKAVLSDHGTATNKRHSETLDSDMLYMATYSTDLGVIVRTAIPLTLYQESVRQLQFTFVWVLLATLVLLGAASILSRVPAKARRRFRRRPHSVWRSE